MPICPNCENGIGYKDGMVCTRCGFDFKRYHMTSWKILYLKYHPENRSLKQMARTTCWMVLPTMIAITFGVGISYWTFEFITFLYFLLIAAPTALLFTIIPIGSLLREDRLR